MTRFHHFSHHLRRAFTLSPGEWLLFMQAWTWLLIFDIALRTLPFKKVQALVAHAKHPAEPRQVSDLIEQTRLAVDRARYAHLIPMTCLRRSLALQHILGTKGIATQLRIGVAKNEKKMAAHAWLEYNQTAICEQRGSLHNYSAFDEF